MSSNLKRGVDADAASPATKRASLGSDPSPPPTDIKKFEMPENFVFLPPQARLFFFFNPFFS
jgi:hypothetical protein